MSIAAYKGISLWPSRCIEFFNDGPYSHVAWVDDEIGDVYEAWTDGVRKIQSVHHSHTPGTVVNIFEVADESRCGGNKAIREFMISQLGKPYDWPGVLRFVTRGKETDSDNPPHWFCSRLVACAYRKANLPLLNAPDWKINPTTCTYSLRCNAIPVRSLTTVDTSILDNKSLRGYERDISEVLWISKEDETPKAEKTDE